MDINKFGKYLITNRGNTAIYFSYLLLKWKGINELLIPEDGIWISHLKYAKILNFKIKRIKTDKGVPDIKEIEGKLNNESALILCSSPGYLNDLSPTLANYKEIAEEKGAFLVVDNSSFNDLEAIGDINLASFGHWKPMNLGIGGIIGVKNKGLLDEFKEKKAFFKSLVKLPEGFDKKVLDKMNKIEDILTMAFKEKMLLEKELEEKFGENLLIKGLKGKKSLNVAINKDFEKINEVKNYLKEKGLEFREGPEEIRLNMNIYSVELKKKLFK